jgi:hypothetical protein
MTHESHDTVDTTAIGTFVEFQFGSHHESGIVLNSWDDGGDLILSVRDARGVLHAVRGSQTTPCEMPNCWPDRITAEVCDA